MRIIVLGYIIRGPLGGMVWHHLQYILGLKKLGYDVCFLEDSEDYPACYSPATYATTADPAFGLNFIGRCFDKFALNENWAYYDAHTDQWFGKPKAQILEFLATADVLLNVSAANPLRDWSLQVPKRILIDTDPAFLQVRHLTDENAKRRAEKHTAFFTFAENIGAEDCKIPDDGFAWQPTRQPVVLDAWTATKGDKNAGWTTVMQWDSYRTAEYQGRTFGMKSASFDQYVDLPMITPELFELALGSESAPGDLLRTKGWKITDPLCVTRTPRTYQRFIQGSKGEWTVAKHGYVISNSGWFSERSGCYLASARPVITQETGFSKFIPTGKGLFSFNSIDEISAALDTVESDYEAHCAAAREIAVEYFSAEKVLADLMNRV